MREYRGKRIDTGEWVYGWYSNRFDNHYITTLTENGACSEFKVDPSTVGERIGVSDWFDGDLIEITYDTSFIEKEKSVHCIRYRAEEDYPAYDLEPWIDCGMNALAWLLSNSDPSVLSYKVIGSIHDNPELLEVTV